METIAEQTGGKSYHTLKYSYDSIGLPSLDYDDALNRVMKWKESGETTNHKHAVPLKEKADARFANGSGSLFSFFLDGSRRVYKVDDISYNKKVYPVVAGQVGIACCKRENKRMKPFDYEKQLVISLPDICFSNSWDKETDCNLLLKNVNKNRILENLKIQFSKILTYSTSIDERQKLEDFATATIQDYMIESEKKMVADLVKRLDQNHFLLKDGSLEYKPMTRGDVNFRDLRKIKYNYKWVIGVSKSFNPECCLDHTGKPNSNYIANLPLYYRTPVAKYSNEITGHDVCFGVWYIRIRDKSRTLTPFDGVIKVEKIMLDNELDYGIDSELVDFISADLINERNPTCYGSDRRWANHLYPVYLTESFIKSKYLSEELFLSLF